MCQLVQETINHVIPYETTLELRGVGVTFLLPISSKNNFFKKQSRRNFRVTPSIFCALKVFPRDKEISGKL